MILKKRAVPTRVQARLKAVGHRTPSRHAAKGLPHLLPVGREVGDLVGGRCGGGGQLPNAGPPFVLRARWVPFPAGFLGRKGRSLQVLMDMQATRRIGKKETGRAKRSQGPRGSPKKQTNINNPSADPGKTQ